MFITELSLYIRFLKEKLEEGFNTDQLTSMQKYFVSFYQNLRNGISYYYNLPGLSHNTNEQFMEELSNAELELELLNFQYPFINQQ